MTNLPMLMGDVVHRVINSALEYLGSGNEYPRARAEQRVVERFRQAWRESRRRDWEQYPSRATNLFEHYYQEELSEERLLEARDTMVNCIGGFYESDSYRFIKTLSSREWLTREEFDSFDFNGTKVWVKLDFAARHAAKIYIYDWKTGREVQEDEVQLAVYALYALQRWEVKLEDLRLFDIYLRKQLPVKVKVNQAIIDQASADIRASIGAMEDLLEDLATNRARQEKFPLVEEPRVCRRCVFKDVCYPDSWQDL